MYRLSEIANWVGGKLIGEGDPFIEDLVFDSRKISKPASSLFFALRSSSSDGHTFVNAVKEAGVPAAVVERDTNVKGLVQLVVPDSLAALQALARKHRERFTLPVVGITGSNGKTIVKEWLHQLLKSDLQVHRSPKSYNSQIGVALSLWPLSDQDQVALIEAGISQPGEMALLERMIQPTLGVFTHLGDAHGLHFDSEEHKLREKLTLFEHCDKIVAPASNPKVVEALKNAPASLVLWGEQEDCQMVALKLKSEAGKTFFKLSYQEQSTTVQLPFADQASLENALTAITAAVCLGIPLESAGKRASQLRALDMRLQEVPGINNNTLLLDHYNADLQSLKMAMDFLNQQHHQGKKTLILSDMPEGGAKGETLYQAVRELVEQHQLDQFIGIGTAWANVIGSWNIPAQSFASTEEFLSRFPLYTLSDRTILLKGARPYAFERISDRLQARSHQTVLEVNMSRLQHNLNAHKNSLDPQTKMMAMVKAFAYGAGGHQVAKLLEYNNIDYLGVAYTDEALELRSAGIQRPIMVLNPDLNKVTLLRENRVEPNVYSMPGLQQLIRGAGAEPMRIHLEFDTGMHRLGLEESHLPELIQTLQKHTYLEVASVFSHLAVADEPAQDDFTIKQLELFHGICHTLEEGLGKKFIRHIANTAGMQRFPQAQMDMVRLGIGLYGIGEYAKGHQLLPVGEFKSYITQLRKVNAGEGVSYGLHSKSDQDRTIAVVAVGYADGYSRKFSQGEGYFIIQGKKAPVVGNVCMDMCMCDVTDIPCAEGDEATIFGDQPRVEELAQKLGTIPYEVLTSVSERVTRLFYQE